VQDKASLHLSLQYLCRIQPLRRAQVVPVAYYSTQVPRDWTKPAAASRAPYSLTYCTYNRRMQIAAQDFSPHPSQTRFSFQRLERHSKHQAPAHQTLAAPGSRSPHNIRRRRASLAGLELSVDPRRLGACPYSAVTKKA
jgi:hypothetical protein